MNAVLIQRIESPQKGQSATCQREVLNEYCRDRKEAGSETRYQRGIKRLDAKQIHSLAAPSRKETLITIIFFAQQFQLRQTEHASIEWHT